MLISMWFSHAKKSGFTLIEVLITVTIISILAGFIVISLNVTQRLQTTQDRARIELAREVRNAIVTYYSENGEYPNGLRGEERPVCQYAMAPTPACLNLDELVRKGYIEDIPGDELATPPESGLVAYLDNNDNVVVRSDIADVQISSNIPLLFIENESNNLLISTATTKNWSDVITADSQLVKLQLPINDTNSIALDSGEITTDILTATETTMRSNRLENAVAGVVGGVANAEITINADSSDECEVVPPYSNISCDITGFSFPINTIERSSKMQINTKKRGRSNGINARHWLIETLSSASSGLSEIQNMTFFRNSVYFTASYNTKKQALFRTNGTFIEQLTDFYNGSAVQLTKPGVTNIPVEANSDKVRVLAIFNDELYFTAVSDQPRFRLLKTDGTNISLVTEFNLDSSSQQGDTVQKAKVVNDTLYISISGIGTNQVIFRTDGYRWTQITAGDELFTILDTDTEDLYLSRKISNSNSINFVDRNEIREIIRGYSTVRIDAPSQIGSSLIFRTHDSILGDDQLVVKNQADQSLTVIDEAPGGDAIQVYGTDGAVVYYHNTARNTPLSAELSTICSSGNCNDLLQTDSRKILHDPDVKIQKAEVIDKRLFLSVIEPLTGYSLPYSYNILSSVYGKLRTVAVGGQNIIGIRNDPVLGETILTSGLMFNAGGGAMNGIVQSDATTHAGILSTPSVIYDQNVQVDNTWYFGGGRLIRLTLID